ncbi:MAG: DUF4302 domain-containing protein [Prevotella sp.]|nr:DUF4302 domain-containing protein [Prevotella sp.]
MKKILNILLLSIAVFTYSSCVSEVEDVFDKSASVRVAEAIQNDMNVLTSASNGWVMYMYGDMDYGGWNVLCKFNTDNTVEVATDATEDYFTQTTHFKIEQSAGVVLSFDEYNDAMHFFSDPVSPAGLGTKGEGFGGDLEFRIISVSNDRIVMKGKKTENDIIMVPITPGVAWEDYVNTLHDWDDAMNEFSLYSYNVGGREAEMKVGTHNFNFTYTDDNGVVQKVSAPYIVKEGGVLLYDTLKIFGANVTEFAFNNETFEYTANDGGGVMVPVVPPINEQFVGSYWYTSLNNIGAFGQPYWTWIKNNIMPRLEEDLRLFIFGASVGSWAEAWGGDYFGASFNSGGYAGAIGFDYKLIGENQISLTYNGSGPGNGAWYVANAYFHYLVVPFGANNSGAGVTRTFTITTDDIKKPTWIQLNDNDNPNNVIKLFRGSQGAPLDN